METLSSLPTAVVLGRAWGSRAIHSISGRGGISTAAVAGGLLTVQGRGRGEGSPAIQHSTSDTQLPQQASHGDMARPAILNKAHPNGLY